MDDHAYSFYCKDKYWQRCIDEDLEVVEVLHETYDEDGSLAQKEAIYRCRKCGGFYKQRYRAIYYPSHLFDTEEGWDISNDYFRIDEPMWKTLNSTLDVPFPLYEARRYGYTGEDRSWKNGRCNFPEQNVELTCRAADLQFVAYRTPELRSPISDKFYKCRRCGEWYWFRILPPYTEALHKPTHEFFPLEDARAFGYEEKKDLENKKENESGKNQTDLDAPERTRKTLRVVVQEALVLPTKNVIDSNYKVNFFCRVPPDWLENGRLRTELWNKIGNQVFGENRQAETFPGAHYIIKSSETKIFDDDEVKNRNWRDVVNVDDLFYFFIGSENGDAKKVDADEFQADIDARSKGL
jgi:hypothetical protein